MPIIMFGNPGGTAEDQKVAIIDKNPKKSIVLVINYDSESFSLRKAVICLLAILAQRFKINANSVDLVINCVGDDVRGCKVDYLNPQLLREFTSIVKSVAAVDNLKSLKDLKNIVTPTEPKTANQRHVPKIEEVREDNIASLLKDNTDDDLTQSFTKSFNAPPANINKDDSSLNIEIVEKESAKAATSAATNTIPDTKPRPLQNAFLAKKNVNQVINAMRDQFKKLYSYIEKRDEQFMHANKMGWVEGSYDRNVLVPGNEVKIKSVHTLWGEKRDVSRQKNCAIAAKLMEEMAKGLSPKQVLENAGIKLGARTGRGFVAEVDGKKHEINGELNTLIRDIVNQLVPEEKTALKTAAKNAFKRK